MNPGTEALVARILQPLARSLEEARRHLNLEAAQEADGEDAEIDTRELPAPAFATRARLTPGLAAPARPDVPSQTAPHHSTARAGFDASASPLVAPPARAPARPSPAFHPATTTVTPTTPDAVPAGATRADAASSPIPPSAGKAGAPTPAFRPASDASASDSAPRPPSSLLRIAPTDEAPPSPADFVATGAAPRPSPESPDQHAVATAAPPGQARPAAPLPASAASRSTPPAAADQPGFATAAPSGALRHHLWRLRPSAAASPPDGHPADPAPSGPVAAPPSPSLLPRNPALNRVMAAMDPVLDKAWQLTDAALAPAPEAPPAVARQEGREKESARSDSPNDAPRVSNHFHVSVALSGDAAGNTARDPQQLEDALVALLRDAARRQGLDV